eukprot:CAMPEP_0172545126 /NCGR_PEP_ID=MMETSP1067-20121228/15131_1 /TAXON_ID=265564 ORGANISM="Thalassiosira punctigera, Strain Tpunct2005C2" /NCGR_SAMPLE_ID=MMETSP1067 /ASSEMBLY_ACC=CAM_ASM_000444 /LENGTH=60 /DNA_ID=CAMNT_0013331811 /DNA_START=23 /DNA_END=201 /DNA_ORIENTATION=+
MASSNRLTNILQTPDTFSRAMIKIQCRLRADRERQGYLTLRKGTVVLQANVRGIQARHHA